MAIYPGNSRGGSPIGNWVGIIMMAVILIGSWFVLKGIFNLLYFLAPILLIATILIDYKVVLSYIKQLGSIFKQNPLYGIGATALTVIFYPIVFTILLFRAFTGRKIRQLQGSAEAERDAEFVDYEELDTEPLDLDEFGKIKVEKDDYYREQ